MHFTISSFTFIFYSEMMIWLSLSAQSVNSPTQPNQEESGRLILMFVCEQENWRMMFVFCERGRKLALEIDTRLFSYTTWHLNIWLGSEYIVYIVITCQLSTNLAAEQTSALNPVRPVPARAALPWSLRKTESSVFRVATFNRRERCGHKWQLLVIWV